MPFIEEHQACLTRRLVKERRVHQTRAPSLGVEPSSPAFAMQQRTSKADACNLHDPRARPGSPEPRSTAVEVALACCFLGDSSLCRAEPVELLRFRGLRALSPSPAPPGGDFSRRGWLPRPPSPGHLLSRRSGSKGWRSHSCRALSRAFYSPTERAGLRPTRPQAPRFHKTSWQGRFPRCPAKGLSFHAPKVPSIVGLTPPGGNLRVPKHPELPSSRGGWAIVHRLFPACGYLTGAFSTPADWTRLDGRTRARARVLVFVAGP
jgi:hypothetical protein